MAKKNKRVDLDTRPIGPWRKNYDYGTGPFFGTPGGGEKSMGDWIKKDRKKRRKKLKALQASANVLRMAEIYLIKTAAPEDVLNTIPAKDEVKQFILEQPKEHIGPYIGALKKNPMVGIDELQKAVKLPQKREMSEGDRLDEKALFSCNIPKEWAKIQLLKARSRDPNPTEKKYPFWYNLASWFYHGNTFLNEDITYNEFEDWFRNVHPNLASLDLDQACLLAIRWHAEQASKGAGLKYEGPDNIVYGPEWKNPEWKGWTIRKVTSENDLLVEGNKMNHCVGSYCENVKNNTSTIYSLRDPQNEPHATMETDGGSYRFEQIMGHSNSNPKSEYKKMLSEWFKTLSNITIDENDNIIGYAIEIDAIPLKDMAKKMQEAFSENEYGIPIDLTDRSVDFNVKQMYTEIMEKLLKTYPHGEYHGFMREIAKQLADLTIRHDRGVINQGNARKAINSHMFELPRLFSVMDEHYSEYVDNIDSSGVPKHIEYPEEIDYTSHNDYMAAVGQYNKYHAEYESKLEEFEQNRQDVLPLAFNREIQGIVDNELRQHPFPNYDWLRGVPFINEYLVK